MIKFIGYKKGNGKRGNDQPLRLDQHSESGLTMRWGKKVRQVILLKCFNLEY